MKSITIHNIDEKTTALLKEKSKEWGLSMDETIQRLLRETLDVEYDKEQRLRAIQKYAGIWSDEEAAEFESNIEDFNKINPRDWD